MKNIAMAKTNFSETNRVILYTKFDSLITITIVIAIVDVGLIFKLDVSPGINCPLF